MLSVLPGTLAEAELARRLGDSEAAVIMKVGRNLAKIRRALTRGGQARRARSMSSAATMERDARRCRSPTSRTTLAPYFSLVLVPGWEGRP